MTETLAIDVVSKPFVGLRPFESSEGELFFGREEQVQQLLGKLHASNFVAVVGSSGSGKSSLVKAGLIPALKAGFLNQGDHWYIASFRPGDNPLHYFAQSLADSFAFGQPCTEIEKAIQMEGADEIESRLTPYLQNTSSSLLILVDQFEEVFTHFRNVSEQAALMYRFEFIKIILELIHSHLPIYIILTMRSDFIGKCNMFHGLAEELSNSQFLVPRLHAAALYRVIEGPLRLFGCSLERGLSQKVLNDLEDNEDQLPVLQHTMSQVWCKRQVHETITYEDYQNTGGLKNSISVNANAIYENLVKNHPSLKTSRDRAELKEIMKEMFQYLIDFDDSKSEGVRQPRKVHEIQLVTGASFDQIKIIFDAFSIEDANFLFSQSTDTLKSHSLIDISHESLMREWDKFKDWKKEEEKNKRYIERLDEFATEYKDKKKNTLHGPELSFYLNWSKYIQYNQHEKKETIGHWAKRYNIDFQKVNDYIRVSKAKVTQKKVIWTASIALLIAAMAVGAYEIRQWNIENESKVQTMAFELNRRDSLGKSEALVAKLENKEALNRALASKSMAQQALFEYNTKANRLEQEVLLLKKTLKERDAVIQSLERSNDNQKEEQISFYNKRLSNELNVTKSALLKTTASIDSLKAVVGWYELKSGVSYTPANTSYAHLVAVKLVERSKVDLGKKLNYQIDLAINAGNNLPKIRSVSYYVNGKAVAKSSEAALKFQHRMQVKANAPIFVELEFTDGSLKTIPYHWN